MLAFEEGTHIIMEVFDEDGIEIVGGFLGVSTDHGVTLNTTHKVQKVVPEMTEAIAGQIRAAVEKMPKLALRLMAAIEVRDLRGAFKLTHEDMVNVVCYQQEQQFIKDNTHKEMAPLPTPVATFYASQIVRTVEVTEDYNVVNAMRGLDDVIKGIRAEAEKKAEEAPSEREEGTDGGAAQEAG